VNDGSELSDVDFQAFLDQMTLPEAPSDALARAPEMPKLVRELDAIATASILAGLQTEPIFQANFVRLDFAVRFVLAFARGRGKPRRSDLHQLLNVTLERARVTYLEDPIEDFFVEPVPTPLGDFLIFSGVWEQAAFYTETIVSAFARLADVVPVILGDWIEPEVILSPTGDVLIDHRFQESTLQRSAERRHQKERSKQSDAYASRFGEPKQPKSISDDFRAAIAAEYGADSEAVLDLPAATARLAANRNSGVLIISRYELVEALESLDAMQGQSLSKLIDRLTMPRRAHWDEIPSGFSGTDFDPARFDRRPSLIARPIIALSSGENPLLAVAPAVIERTLFHNLGGAMSGTLQNDFWQSREMQIFSSASGTRTGLEFNDAIATRIEELGLRAWSSAKPAWALNCKATPEIEKLGDVDVLAVSPDGSRVWVIEAKDLKLCRTMGEIARRLSEYRGREDAKGRPDKMLRHLRRVAYLQEHAGELVGRLKLPRTPKISGALVVRAPQPMEHIQVSSPNARVVMYDDVGTVPWQDGW
jgi:hypothetical protein